MKPRTCVDPTGRFVVGVHEPSFTVENLRTHKTIEILGQLPDGTRVDNQINFPETDVHEPGADRIYEIANPFPFRGTTYINSAWADPHAGRPDTIGVPIHPPCSLLQTIDQWQTDITDEAKTKLLELLPHPLLIALAQASTDPEELAILARKTCTLLFEQGSPLPWGIGYKQKNDGAQVPDIHDHEVFEVLVNNPFLPDAYKKAMVLKPGVQGKSEIIGEFSSRDTHVFEYLRRNSYIPWGHYASNMADDAIRYRAKDLTDQDMTGLRHLYYQRAYVRVAAQLKIALPARGTCLTPQELEALRQSIQQAIVNTPKSALPLPFNGSLWGWNFGFGVAQSGHRLHASHQMIHQQNALIPAKIRDDQGNAYDSFSWGDLVSDFISEFERATGKHFFESYLTAIRNNERTDKKNTGENSLIVHEDPRVILFVPKAQVSEWELCLMTKSRCGNILEADTALRTSLDHAMLIAIQTLEHLGAQMITAVELSGRFDRQETDQHLLYSFLPRLPYAPGTFSEAQLRWISGCYPEDFAQACRKAMGTMG